MIRVTLGDLVDYEAALTRVAKSVRLRGQLLYHVVKLQTLVAAETRVFFQARAAAIDELSIDRDASLEERVQLGTPTVREVPMTAMPAFRQRLADISKVDVEIDWRPIPFRELAAHDIAPADLTGMGPLIDLTYDADQNPQI